MAAPEKLKVIIESHLTWLEELQPDVQISAKSRSDSLKQFATKILKCVKSCKSLRLEEGTGSLANNWRRKMPLIAKILTYSSLYICSGDWNSAISLLMEIQDYQLDNLESRSEDQLKVVKYCRDALWWTINDCDEEKAEELGEIWRNLICDKKCEAFTAFLKGYLAMKVFVEDQKTLEYFVKAIQLDPDDSNSSVLYYEQAYQCSDWIRKNISCTVNGYNKPLKTDPQQPSKEFVWVKQAYDLASDDAVIITNYALAQREFLRHVGDRVWRENRDKYLRVADMLELALATAEDEGNPEFIEKTKAVLAEYLYFGKGEDLNKERGYELFEQLVEKYDSEQDVGNFLGNSFVLFKLSRYSYSFYKNDTSKREDLERSERFMKNAVKGDPANFRMVVEYFKIVKDLGGGLKEMLPIIDNILEIKGPLSDSVIAKFYSLRGIVFWLYGSNNEHRKRAVGCWIWVLKTFRAYKHQRNVFDIIQSPEKNMLPLDYNCRSPIQNVVNYLYERKRRADVEDLAKVKSLYFKLKEILDRQPNRKK